MIMTKPRRKVSAFFIATAITVVFFIPLAHYYTQNIKEPKIEKLDVVAPKHGRVHACVFTGRWMYLRILLPYLYRELRQNGGVVDRVLFAMIGYSNETEAKLQNFSTAANSILNDEVFQLMYLNEDTGDPGGRDRIAFYSKFYYVVLQHLLWNPSDVYFKLDDDVVYLHPNVFSIMLKNKNTSDCFIHFGNIVSNWECNRVHQQIGVYDNEMNPKGLKFGNGQFPLCGWKEPECTEMALRTFVHHYHKKQLTRYLYRERRHVAVKGERFSIHFFLIDVDIMDFKRMMELGAIHNDEEWWTMKYSRGAPHTNCIVGDALVVHFSYSTTAKQMLDLGLLREFENIVLMEHQGTLPRSLWKATDFF